MAEIFTLQQSDDLSSVVERIRQSSDDEVGVLIPKERHAFINPVTLRLLQKFSGEAGKTTKIISNDARIQDLARNAGFPVFATIHSFHNGVEAADGAGATAVAVAEERGAEGSSAPDAASQRLASTTAAGIGTVAAAPVVRAGRVTKTDASWTRTRKGKLTVAGGIVAVLLVLLVVVVPAANVTVHFQGDLLQYDSVLTGSSAGSPTGANGTFETTPLTAQESKNFKAVPTGTTNINGASSTGYVQITSTLDSSDLLPCSSYPAADQANCPTTQSEEQADGYFLVLQKNSEFTTAGTGSSLLEFDTTAQYCITFGNATASQPEAPGVVQAFTNGSCTGSDLAGIPVQDMTQNDTGNVGVGEVTQWPDNPCSSSALQQQETSTSSYFFPFNCQSTSGSTQSNDPFTVTNVAAFTGGVTPTPVSAASQADLTGFQNTISTLKTTETSDLTHDISTQLNGLTLAQDIAGNGISFSFVVSPPIPTAPNTQWNATTITVTGTASATAFSGQTIKEAVVTALISQSPPGTVYAPSSLNYASPVVTEATSSSVIVSVDATAYSVPTLPKRLSSDLTGRGIGSLTGYLRQTIGAEVTGTTVEQSPYPLPMLPLLSSKITIHETFSCNGPSCTGGQG